MILFFADGRLGNQLFQYMFLKTFQTDNETLLVIGFDQLKEVFDTQPFFHISKRNKWVRVVLYRLIKPFLTYLSNKNIISSAEIDKETILNQYRRESTTYSLREGIFSNFKLVKFGIFHSESFFSQKALTTLHIKESFMIQAKSFLDSVPGSVEKVFIHIRLGDYKDYKVLGQSTIPPLSYYKKCIERFLITDKDYFFIFLSDEPELIKNEFDYLPMKKISYNNDTGTDLAIMTQCQNAILSPSSFSWWGAYFMEKKNTIYAPKFWLGFNSKIEYPLGCIPDFIQEIDVE